MFFGRSDFLLGISMPVSPPHVHMIVLAYPAFCRVWTCSLGIYSRLAENNKASKDTAYLRIIWVCWYQVIRIITSKFNIQHCHWAWNFCKQVKDPPCTGVTPSECVSERWNRVGNYKMFDYSFSGCRENVVLLKTKEKLGNWGKRLIWHDNTRKNIKQNVAKSL